MSPASILKKILLLFSILPFAACDSGIVVAPPPKLGEFTPNALNLGQDYPADIDIVDQPNLRSTAFVTLTFPAMVIAVDLNSNPLKLSTEFRGLPSENLTGLGIPSSLLVVDATHAFLLSVLTSGEGKIIYFNPTDGSIYQTLPLNTPIVLAQPLKRVDRDGNPLPDQASPYRPTFPAGLLTANSKLFVSFSNLSFGDSGLEWTQGVVLAFNIRNQAPYLVPSTPDHVVMNGFNTTNLNLLADQKILVTNTGATKTEAGKSLPVTEASVEVLDLPSSTIQSQLGLGRTSPSYASGWAITKQGRAFIGSSTGGYLLEIQTNPLRVIHGKSEGLNNPIFITNTEDGTDYINSLLLSRKEGGLFVTSYNASKLFGVDLTTPEPSLLPKVIDLSLPGNPGLTGAGPMALRPGEPGIDFTGPDLFLLTATPGTIAAVKTY